MNTEATYARMLGREFNTLRNSWQAERVTEGDVLIGMQKYGRQAQITALKTKGSLNALELKELAELTALQHTYSTALKGTASTIDTINGVVMRGSLAAGVKLGVANLTIALKGMTEQTALLQNQERAGIITKRELNLALTQQAVTQCGVLATIDAEILATRNLGIVQLGNVERLTQLRTAQSQYTAALASTIAAQQASAGLFRSGLYGEGWTALLVALLVSLVTWAAADAQWRGKVHAAALQGLPIVMLPAPALTDPTPAPIPAPVEAVPVSKDPDMLTLRTLLFSALSLGSTPATPGQSSALGTWVDTWLPKLKADVQAMGTGLNAVNLLVLARDVTPAANQLAGVFIGTDRAEVAAITLRFAV